MRDLRPCGAPDFIERQRRDVEVLVEVAIAAVRDAVPYYASLSPERTAPTAAAVSLAVPIVLDCWEQGRLPNEQDVAAFPQVAVVEGNVMRPMQAVLRAWRIGTGAVHRELLDRGAGVLSADVRQGGLVLGGGVRPATGQLEPVPASATPAVLVTAVASTLPSAPTARAVAAPSSPAAGSAARIPPPTGGLRSSRGGHPGTGSQPVGSASADGAPAGRCSGECVGACSRRAGACLNTVTIALTMYATLDD